MIHQVNQVLLASTARTIYPGRYVTFTVAIPRTLISSPIFITTNPFMYISPFYHHVPVSSPRVLTNSLCSPYSETADFNHDGALLHSHPRSTAADKIYQRYILTCLPRRHIQNEDFNPAGDEDSSHHVTFLCTKKLFISLALHDEPPVQLHQKLPPRKTQSGILTPSKRTIGTTRNDAQITTLSGNPPTAWPGSRRTGSYRSRHGPWRGPWP